MRRWLRPSVMLAMGCVLGYRGEAPIAAEHDLTGIDDLRIDVPDSPLSVVACAADVPATCPTVLVYEGRFVSTGGTGKDARDNAADAQLVLERDDSFAVLHAVIPLDLRGLVDLELDEVRVPDDVHLDLRTGVGDVEVFGTVASVTVETEVGDVTVNGGDAGVGVHTGRGDVDVTTAGHATVRTDRGRLEFTQQGALRELYARSRDGNVVVHLGGDSDIDLVVHASGTIRVQTPAITTVTSGSYERRVGSGNIVVEIRADEGDVDVDVVGP